MAHYFKRLPIPKGLIVLAIISMLSSAWTVRILARPDARMIFFGQILSGLSFKEYYAGLALMNFLIAVGLLYRQRWSFVGFISISAWIVFVGLINICTTTNDTLIKAGWKSADSLASFRILQTVGVIVAFVMALWLQRYRNQFSVSTGKSI